MTDFTADVYQNEYLPEGGSEVNAVVEIRATGGPIADGGPVEAAEVIIIDVSGSMGDPGAKLKAAKKATAVAIDCIRDGVAFGVIAGTDQARQVYPPEGGLAPASESTRSGARDAVAKLKAGGGTAIGTWLRLADELFASRPGAIHHAILLTDGRDDHETPADLDSAIAACTDRFQCDCRGVGTDWQVSELRKIASALLGTVELIAEPSGLAPDFEALIEQSMGKAANNVALRLWMPEGATRQFVKQVSPTIEDLTARGAQVDELTMDYPTGAWGEEERDYQICIKVPARAVGQEIAAGRLRLVIDGEAASPWQFIKAIWTDDERLSTRINREVAAYSGQVELAEAIQEGLAARAAGDGDLATRRLGRAVQIAAENGNETKLKELSAVVEVEDAANGTVRLKRAVSRADEMALDTRSTRTSRLRRAEQ